MNKDEEAKVESIKAFHDDAHSRIEFLMQLYREDHTQEALTLCVCYLDGFARWLLWPFDKSGENFVQAIIQFGGDPLMGLVHPLQAIRSFEAMRPPWPSLAGKLKKAFPGPHYELLSRDEFLGQLGRIVTPEERNNIEAEYWRGTLAATAYYYLRNPLIHTFGASELFFSSTTYKGKPIWGIEFSRLYEIAKRLHEELRRRSETSKQWFGNDSIVGI